MVVDEGIQIRTDRKKLILKKASRRQQKHKKIPSMQRVKEGFDARAISVIRRRPVKCFVETAQLVRISCAFFGHSCNKYLILMGRFVTDALVHALARLHRCAGWFESILDTHVISTNILQNGSLLIGDIFK